MTWLAIGVVTLFILGSYGVAAFRASDRLKEIEWITSVPVADPGTAENRPARYVGRLYGPEDRRTPLGRPASAYW